MARWNSYIEDDVGDGANTIAGIIANGPTYGIGISSDVYVTGMSTFSGIVRFTGNIRIDGQLKDGDNAFGSSGQVLSSDGTDTRWVNAAQLSAGAAAQIAINSDNSSNSSRFITFVNSSSGNNDLKTDTGLTYNPSTNTISASFDGNLTGNVTGAATRLTVTDESSDTNNFLVFTNGATGNQTPHTGTNLTFDSSTGQLNATSFSGSGASLTSLNASNISSGTLNTARLPNTYTKAAKVTIQATGLTNDVHLDAADNIILESGEEESGAIYFRGNNGASSYRFSKAGQTTHEGFLSFESLGADRTFTFPNATGTVALTSSTVANATTLANSRNFSISGEITASAESFNGGANVTLSATVDNNVIDEANLKVSNNPTNGYFLQYKDNTDELTWAEVDTSASGLSGNTLASGVTASSITSLGTLTGLTVNGTLNVNNGNVIQLRTSTNNNLRGYIQATETNDEHLIIATSGGEDIAFKDGGLGGTTNMRIRGDGNVIVTGSVTANSFVVGSDTVDHFPSGTKMIFHQSAAPTGWTKITSNTNQRALRVVSGNISSGGGSHNFTTVFTSNRATSGASVSSHTLTTAQIPSHTHDTPNHTHTVDFDIGNTDLDHTHDAGSYNTDSQGNHNHEITDSSSQDSGDGFAGYQGVSGGGGSNNVNSSTNGSHTHDITGSSGSALGNHNHDVHNLDVTNASPTTHSEGGGQGHSHGFSDATVDLAVYYLDVIIAEKD